MAGGKLGPARFAGGVGPCGASTISTAEDLPIKAGRRDRDREQIACTGTPEAPGTPAA